MAGGGYRGIPAAVPTTQNLHSASRGGDYRNSTARRPTGRPVSSSVRIYPVGASLLAMDVQTTRSFRPYALSLTSIASRLAPTVDCCPALHGVTPPVIQPDQVGYQAASLWFLILALILICPVGRPYVRGAGAWLLGAFPSNPP